LNSDKVKFTLLENGIDFILSALERLSSEPTSRDLKYSVLHLCSGIELILKERLMREHWSLVFDKIERAKLSVIQSGGKFTSVTFMPCIERLIQIGGLEYLADHRGDLELFRDRRNQIEHFGFVDSAEAIKSSASKALNFLYDFIHRELHPSDDLFEQLDEMLKYLRDFEHFVNDRMIIVQREVADSYSPVMMCPKCRQSAITIDANTAFCHFCMYTASGEEAANEYVEEVLNISSYEAAQDGCDWPVYDCPECGRDSLVHNDNEFTCFSCGSNWEFPNMRFCESCRSPFSTNFDKHDFMCSACWEIKIQQ